MIAIVGGLGAALSWAIATLASTRSSRMIGAFSVLAWVMIVGFLASLVPAVLTFPATIDTLTVVELLVAGFSYTIGLLLAYRALVIGRVSIVAPITATEGALAAVLAVVLGEPLALATALLLAVITTGIVLSAIERAVDVEQGRERIDPEAQRRAVLLAIGAAAAFSIGLVVAGRLGVAGVSPALVILSGRLVGVLTIAAPLVVRGRLRLVRAAVPLVIVSGVLEALGSGLYVIAASDGVAAAAVLSSQFAAFAAVAAYFVFGERLQRVQILGVVLIALGVTALAFTQA